MADKLADEMKQLEMCEQKKVVTEETKKQKKSDHKPKKQQDKRQDSDEDWEDMAFFHMMQAMHAPPPGSHGMGPMGPMAPQAHPWGPPGPPHMGRPMGPPPMGPHMPMGPMMGMCTLPPPAPPMGGPHPNMHRDHEAMHKKAMEEHAKRMAEHHTMMQGPMHGPSCPPYPMWGFPGSFPRGPGMHRRHGGHGPGRKFWKIVMKNGFADTSSSSSSEDESISKCKKAAQCDENKKTEKCKGKACHVRKEKKKAWRRAMKAWMASQNGQGAVAPPPFAPAMYMMMMNSEGETSNSSPDTDAENKDKFDTQPKSEKCAPETPMNVSGSDSSEDSSDEEAMPNPMAMYHFQMMKHHRQMMKQSLAKRGRGGKRGCGKGGHGGRGGFGGRCAIRKECQAMRQAGCDKETIKKYRQQMLEKLQERNTEQCNQHQQTHCYPHPEQQSSSSVGHCANMSVDGHEIPPFLSTWSGDSCGMSGTCTGGDSMSREEWFQTMKEQKKAWRQQCKKMAEEVKKQADKGSQEKSEEFEVLEK